MSFSLGNAVAANSGWRTLGAEDLSERVLDWTTRLPEKAGGVFANEDGDIFCTGRGYKGEIVPSRKPKPGEAFTWNFRLGDRRAYWPVMGLQWGKSYALDLSCRSMTSVGWNMQAIAADGKKARIGYGNFSTKANIGRLFHWDGDASATLDRLLNKTPVLDFSVDTCAFTLAFEETRVRVFQNGVLSGSFKVDKAFYDELPVLQVAPYVHFRGLTVRPLPQGFACMNRSRSATG